ncbi:MAG TPA: hypothetical protein IAB61_13365 [Candidatus Merdisoma merdipullorum]|nr:hypothetical protein [Candidatus Merdisoma merdipullorum]
MRRRLKKKKGLLKDPEYEKLKEKCFEELEREASELERMAEEMVNCKPKSKTD